MKTAIVTGSTGFIGQRLAAKLKSLEWNVIELTRKAYDVSKDEDGAKLRAIFEKEKPNAVFHLASKFLAEHKSEDLPGVIESNVLLGARLLQTITETSTADAPIDFLTAGTGWQRFSKEDGSAVNLYAATKAAFSAVTDYYSMAANIRTAELRLFDTYGPGDTEKKIVQQLFDTAKNPPAAPLDFSPGQQKLYMVHVDDAVNAFVVAEGWLSKQPMRTRGVFRVDAESMITLKDLAREVEMLTKSKLAITWGGRPYRDREVMLPYSELKRIPGWAPTISLRQGLRDLLESSK
ncbi:NAD(P)-dependent oxidoreductase [soil metagenome]